jgi:hypothetical protein
VPSAQGFFVKANNFAPAMTIPNSARLHNSQPNYKSSETNFVKLSLDGNGYTDEILIRAIEGADYSFDSKYDAYKLWGIEEAPQLFSIVGNDNLSINTIPELEEGTIIPIGVKVENQANCSLYLNEVELANNQEIYLEDLKTGAIEIIDLNEVYAFEAKPTDEPHRFNLHLGTIDQSDGELGGINIYSSDDVVYVNISEPIDGTIIIYDLTGKKLIQKDINNDRYMEIKVGNGTGIYFVEVLSNLENITGKVFIK